jgi:tRNA (cytidine32/uridine32-2'-O)-methyltransferase
VKNIRIVLVNTSHPDNIGGVARAMKNMGLCELYLVAPKRFPDEEAVWRAASAVDLLDTAVVTGTLDEALEGCGLIIGTSARERRIPWPLLDPRQCGELVCQESSHHPVALVFGREDRGLKNEELRKCHYHVHIPTDEGYSSLNLAAAVQVISYEVRMAFLGAAKVTGAVVRDWDVEPAENEEMEYFYQHLEKVLKEIEFIQASKPRQTMNRLRRLFNRVRMDKMELAMLRGVLTNIEKINQ